MIPAAYDFSLSNLFRLAFALALWSSNVARAQADGAQRWAFATLSTSLAGDILSSPSRAADGTIYFGIEIGSASSTTPGGRLFALRGDGTQRWVYTTPDWIDSTPVIAADGTVLFGCWDGNLYALRPDGTLKWATSTGAFISSSAAIGPDETIYIGTGDGDLMAVNPDGTIKWTFSVSEWIDGSPIVGPDGTIYFGSWNGSFYAVRPDGTEKWHFDAGDDIVASAALAADGMVYFGSRDHIVYALNSSGELQWSAQLGDTIETSPALGAEGTIYVTTTGGRLFALARDGTERWRYPAANQAALNALYSSPAVRADGAVIFGSSNNALFGVNADGSLKFKTVLGDWSDSSPLVTTDGIIYIGCSDKRFYSLNSSAILALTDWPQFHRNEQRDGRQPMGAVAGTDGQLVNLSVLTYAGTAGDTLIVGFYVNGGGGGRRNLLVRGIGPTLTQYFVNGVLSNPAITAFAGSTVIGGNDDWGSAMNPALIASTAESVAAFPLPSGSLDAALVREFSVGGYTVHVNGAGGSTGIALMELYDSGGTAGTRLTNISARSAVTPGNGVLTAGFVVNQRTRAILVRGIGPGLVSHGVAGALVNPHLRIFRAGQVVAENDDWGRSTNSTAIAASTLLVAGPDSALASGSKDAVLLVTLPAGGYTARVSGTNATSGVGLVEIFELP